MTVKIENILIIIALLLCAIVITSYVLINNEPKEVKVYQPNTTTAVLEQNASAVVNNSNKININTASKEQLMSLSGVGEVLAQRIIDYRSTGDYVCIEDVKKVEGIGDKKFESIKDFITVK